MTFIIGELITTLLALLSFFLLLSILRFIICLDNGESIKISFIDACDTFTGFFKRKNMSI
jgi:hypothetical protein